MSRQGRAECIHDDVPLYLCTVCENKVCKNCLEKYHESNCVFVEMVKVLKDEPIGFILFNDKRIYIHAVTDEGYLVKTYRKKKLSSGVIKTYGPYWERHNYDDKTQSSFFVKYIGKIYTENKENLV